MKSICQGSVWRAFKALTAATVSLRTQRQNCGPRSGCNRSVCELCAQPRTSNGLTLPINPIYHALLLSLTPPLVASSFTPCGQLVFLPYYEIFPTLCSLCHLHAPSGASSYACLKYGARPVSPARCCHCKAGQSRAQVASSHFRRFLYLCMYALRANHANQAVRGCLESDPVRIPRSHELYFSPLSIWNYWKPDSGAICAALSLLTVQDG